MKTEGNKRARLLYSLVMNMVVVVVIPAVLAGQSTSVDAGLQPGDKVTVTVWQRPELSGDFTVAPDGSLNHPLYRQVRVMGSPATQVEERLRSFLSGYEANPQVVVQPYYKVAIAGSVMRPDLYDVAPGTTVVQAVTQAGGVTENGDREEVTLYRQGNEMELDLAELEAVQIPVQSGDQILVKAKGTEGFFRQTLMPIIQVGFWIANIVIWNNR